jgi:Uma2 family endonuclease
MTRHTTVISSTPQVPAKKRTSRLRRTILTYKDYAAITPANNGNYALINGNIIFIPSPTPQHQDVVTELAMLLRVFAKTNDLGKVFTAPLDITFDELNTFQPDIIFIKKDRAHFIGAKKVEGAPDFVVEILSEGNIPKEMAFKKYIYETFMVREYWVVNLKKKTIVQYLNEEGEFQKIGTFNDTEVVKSIAMEGFQTKLEDLL